MANLLSNAAKFSFEDSTVNVEIKQNSDRVCVAVTEQGPGIPEDFQGKIFDKFGWAINTDDRQHEGAGLGLAISKFIVEHHGGDIDFDTQIGVGTTFYFDLPTQGQQTPWVPRINRWR